MSLRTDNSNLTWDNRSVWWQQSYDEGVPGGDRNLMLFAEDLGTEIWGYFNRSPRQEDVNNVFIQNCSEDMREILINCLPFNDYSEDLSSAISNFAMQVAQEFILNGQLLFEILKGWDNSADMPGLESVKLEMIPHNSVVQFGRWAFQVIPPKVDTEELITGGVIRLNRSLLVVFMPPHRWRRLLARIREGFKIMGEPEQDWRININEHKTTEDFKVVNLAYTVQRARLTAPIGWNARGLFRDHIADFHWFSRELRWKRFCIEVRDSILMTIRELFAHIGSWKGENPLLVWDHLPNVQMVEEAEKRIMGPGARFDEVLNL